MFHRAAAAAPAFLLAALTGCGAGEARVSGTVTLDGQPVAGAQVVFVREGSGPVVAQTDEAGRYTLVGNGGAGIPVGEYRVTVTKEALPDGTVPAGEALMRARSAGKLKNVLPAKYEAAESTPLKFDIASGPRAIDLSLTK